MRKEMYIVWRKSSSGQKEKGKNRKEGREDIYTFCWLKRRLCSPNILDLVELNSSFASRPTKHRNGPSEVWFSITVVQWGYSNC